MMLCWGNTAIYKAIRQFYLVSPESFICNQVSVRVKLIRKKKKISRHVKNKKCKSITSRQNDINTIKFHKILFYLTPLLNAFLSSGVTWFFFFLSSFHFLACDTRCNWQSLAALCQRVLSRYLGEEYKFVLDRRCSTKTAANYLKPCKW